jgi:hypothetical protein
MPHRRLRPIARGLALVPALVAAAVAACADSPVAPAARPAGLAASLAAESFGLTPTFATIDAKDQTLFDFLPANALGTPVAPIPFDTAGTWSIVRHQRDRQHWYQIEQMDAWHGRMCQKPDDPTVANRTHPVSEYRDMVFLCRNHLMTATNSRGYGINYLTPGRVVDFSEGAVVRFDVATLRESGRDWIDLWLTPYGDNLVAPLDDSLPDLQGEPRRAVHLRMTSQRDRSVFGATVFHKHDGTPLPVADTTSYETAFAARGLAPSATRRDTFELHISRTHVRFGMPRYNLWWVDASIPGGLDWSRAVIQLGHHSFDPTAESGGRPTTWHWDNVGASPAVPFTILRASRRYVDASTANGEVTLPQPSPDGAFLRAASIGAAEVSFAKADGKFGKWRELRLQRQERHDAERFASVWMPVPEGTTRVRFRASGGGWMVRDVEVWGAPAGEPKDEDDDKDKDDDKDDDKDERDG